MRFKSIFTFLVLVLIFAPVSLTAQTANPASSITERFNPISQQWENIQKLTYEFGEQGEQTALVAQVWNDETSDWTLFSDTRSEYDQAGNLQAVGTKLWHATQMDWVNAQRVDYTYSGTTQTSSSLYSWNDVEADWTASVFEQIVSGKSTSNFDHEQQIDTVYDAYGRATESTITSFTNGETRSMRIVYTYSAKEDASMLDTASIQNYPNPVATFTTIEFDLALASEVNIQMYDMQGRMVAQIANGAFDAGTQTIDFDASDLTPGTYLYTLTVDGAQLAANNMIVVGQ